MDNNKGKFNFSFDKNLFKNVDLDKLLKERAPQHSFDSIINDPTFNQDIENSMAEKRRREEEDNENLKRIAKATEDINGKFDNVSRDLEYILNSLGSNFQRLERLEREEKEILDQILLALQYKNSEESKNKIRELLTGKAPEVVINVITAYIQLKITGG